MTRRAYHYFHCTICDGITYWATECKRDVCRGNVARHELAKLRYGVRLRYLRTAAQLERWIETPHCHFIGRYLTSDISHQGRKAIRVMIDLAYLDGGYCIDAPEVMPAGGCFSELIEEAGPDEWIPSQIKIRRES